MRDKDFRTHRSILIETTVGTIKAEYSSLGCAIAIEEYPFNEDECMSLTIPLKGYRLTVPWTEIIRLVKEREKDVDIIDADPD